MKSRALKWSLIAVGLMVGVLLAVLFTQAYFLKVANDRFAQLSPAERRLAIYDAFGELIDEHYYDREFSGMDWPALRKKYREKVPEQAHDFLLYENVLRNLGGSPSACGFVRRHEDVGLVGPRMANA